MGDGDGETTMETSWQVGQVVGGAYQVQELLRARFSCTGGLGEASRDMNDGDGIEAALAPLRLAFCSR